MCLTSPDDNSVGFCSKQKVSKVPKLGSALMAVKQSVNFLQKG